MLKVEVWTTCKYLNLIQAFTFPRKNKYKRISWITDIIKMHTKQAPLRSSFSGLCVKRTLPIKLRCETGTLYVIACTTLVSCGEKILWEISTAGCISQLDPVAILGLLYQKLWIKRFLIFYSEFLRFHRDITLFWKRKRFPDINQGRRLW